MKNFNQREYQTVILGALLHDVGKLLQRGTFGSLDTQGQHPQVSSDFVSAFRDLFSRYVDFELLQCLVQRHHEDARFFKEYLLCQNAPEQFKAMSYLVSRADNYSSSERGKKSGEYRDYKAIPMVSVFSRVKLDKEPPEIYRYRPASLMPEHAFPEQFDLYKENELNNHLQNFGEDFRRIEQNATHNFYVFDAIFSNILTILAKYTWCIPSNTQEDIPDVSLFDHLKTTCAIAACLYHYHFPDFRESEIKEGKAEKFLLLVGDLSGIQNYIFNISNIGAGGIAKRLRARSFQMNIISEIVSHRILHAFNLPSVNILMVSGGKFYVLLPNTKDSQEKIMTIKKDVDHWFYSNLNAEINVNIVAMPLSGNDFGNYGNVIKNINRLLQQKKKRPFENILIYNGSWDHGAMTLNVDFEYEDKLCKACNKLPGQQKDDGKYICKRCADDKKIGQNLPKIKYIAFFKEDLGEFKDYLGYSFDLLDDVQQIKSAAYLVMNIEEVVFDLRFPVTNRFIANYVSTFISQDECEACKEFSCSEKHNVIVGQPKFFQCIANESKGRKMLGYLKADVDNLGAVFAFGLQENNSISRVSTLSRMLDVFFSGYMQKLIEDNYPELYTVYSGGDDVLVIGPWDSIIYFAQELHEKFMRFTCNNKNLTLSAGIAFVKHNYPVFRAVEMADNALDRSKDMGKNRLTLFDHVIAWDEAPDIIRESEKLSKWIEQKQVSSGFARNLLIYSWMNDEFNSTRKTEYLRFLPLMTYDIARNLPPVEAKDPEKREIRSWAEELKELGNPRLKHLGIIANYALTANRGGKDE